MEAPYIKKWLADVSASQDHKEFVYGVLLVCRQGLPYLTTLLYFNNK
jgi:hypothetical protein